MKFTEENALYPHVAKWLARYLRNRFPKATSSAFDTHKTDLSVFLQKKGLDHYFPDAGAFEIKVDITGVVQIKESVKLAFVECNAGPITLRDLGQLLGYSLVARPEFSFLTSPEGVSDKLRTLLLTYGRIDVLQYAKTRTIQLGDWNSVRQELDLSSVIPKGGHV